MSDLPDMRAEKGGQSYGAPCTTKNIGDDACARRRARRYNELQAIQENSDAAVGQEARK
jgi:hypothetical protein